MTVYLFVHQNFPGQYGQLVRHLAAQPLNRVYFITQSNHGDIPGVRKLIYKPEIALESRCHPYAAVLDVAVRTGVAVAAVCKQLRRRGIFPDLVVGHCGWGETLLIKDVFPRAPLLSNFEYFFRAEGADVGFDNEFAPRREEDLGRLRVRNAINFMSADATDWGHTATAWQCSLFPPAMRERISILHEGTDTKRYRPKADAWLKLEPSGMSLSGGSEVITYVARSLEPYRGFHILMRALPELLRRRPRAHVLIIGGEGVSYGAAHPSGRSYREVMLAEVAGRIDLQRVHFMGIVAPEVYRTVLQVSRVHVYLTYPFVLSWSFIEAMASGCLIIGSATPPVLEYLRERENGLLVDFFDTAALCDRIDEALDHPDRFAKLRAGARRTAIDQLDFKTRILPRWLQLFDDLVVRGTPSPEPSVGRSPAPTAEAKELARVHPNPICAGEESCPTAK